MGRPRKQPTVVTTSSFKLYWRPHEYGGDERRRVWRSDWPSDTFEILNKDEFAQLESMCEQFSIWLIEAEDD